MTARSTNHVVLPIPFKPHRLDGLSARLLESHYENNYGGAVRRLNAIEARLAALDPATAPGFELNGLKREQSIAAGSMILHEAYFDALGEQGSGSGGDPGGDAARDALAAAIEASFGALARWRAEFGAMGKALAGGSGWVVLAWSARSQRLVNHWAADHAHGLPGGQPVLALDMYEHAYHMDFGARAADYVDTFMRNIAWQRPAARLHAARAVPASPAPHAAADAGREVGVAALRSALDDATAAPLVLDVRLPDDRQRSGQRLPGTDWRDPQQVEAWAAALPRDREVVVYCMYGFWVSQDAASALRKAGVKARSLQGGIASWRAMGWPTQPIAPC
ncbi:MAG: superoxide dismutase [Alphaproteobacteria bacterium]|nr:superoxide dismutase [Alphaproteobacteria bacterium]